MPEQYTLQEAPKLPIEAPSPKKVNHYIVMAAIAIGFILIFIFGLLLGKGSTPNPQVAVTKPTPTTPTVTTSQVTPLPSSAPEIPIVAFLPNKQYLDDTYVVISQDKPHQTLILSVSRIEQERSFVEYTKINYFDGSKWDRKSTTAVINSNAIVTNLLLRSWTAPTNSVENTQSLATVALPTGVLSFISTDLANEISVQSQPGSTKFIYEGKGTMTIDTDKHPAYVFYSRTYSFNAVDLSYLTQPDRISSNWLLFWDKEGSFYYMDDHKGTQNQTTIPPLAIGVREDNNNAIQRTKVETGNVQINNTVPTYTAVLTFQGKEEVLLPITNAINKADKKTYSWITASGEGIAVKAEGRKVTGLGVVEYIRPIAN